MPSLFQLEQVTLRGSDPSGASRPRLDAVDLALERGITFLCGPSGCGKSSLLRCLVRLELPSGGRVLVDGVEPATPPAVLALRRRVAWVPQRPALFDGSIADNLRVARPQAGDAQLVAQLSRVGLSLELARLARELSGGEQARVALARALLLEPEVLLLDEVSAALDAASAAPIEALVRAHVEAGGSVIWAAHDLGLPERFSGARTIVLSDGRLASDADSARFLGRPA